MYIYVHIIFFGDDFYDDDVHFACELSGVKRFRLERWKIWILWKFQTEVL